MRSVTFDETRFKLVPIEPTDDMLVAAHGLGLGHYRAMLAVSPSAISAKPLEDFADWWRNDGQYIDPDTADVPWFDKRRGLAEAAFRTGTAYATGASVAVSLAKQVQTDLASAHQEICRLQGIDPAAHSWPAWSSQRHTLDWCAEIISQLQGYE